MNDLARRIAIVLAVVAGLFSLLSALIKYLDTGDVDVSRIAGGIALPLLLVAILMKKQARS